MTLSAWQIYLNGIVQGVGFRPFVFKLAREMGIKGWVNNSSHGVNIHAEGVDLERFYQRLLSEAPKLARIVSSRWEETLPQHFSDFSIISSEEDSTADVLISPDVATCDDCLNDLFTLGNRRYHYPFTNCTNCGPRYTIIKKVPYDRAQTTMSVFPMCPECADEYQDPGDRRFHAQPVACNHCGPQAKLLDADGNLCAGLGIKQLEAGAIVAVKGLGGFHLMCDARNEETVERLRSRKERGAKPFALMARNIEKIRTELELSDLEEELLTGTAAPIVILERKSAVQEQGGKSGRLPAAIAPGLHTLGVMLPYTPLHHLLFADGSFDFLVATSANLSGRPLIYDNDEALKELKGIADYFLIHDREIYHPCDDSVVQVMGGLPVFHRRARGYVPLPVFTDADISVPMLAVGGELKNAFALAYRDRIFLSQYIGDIENYENYRRFVQEVKSFQDVVGISPERIVHDAHPDYQTTRYALDSPWPKAKVQHHHAHMVSVLGEHGRNDPVLGVICDGTGYGEDGRIWGFEFLYGNAAGVKRMAHLQYLPLPGGDAGAKHPLRIAYAYLKVLFSPAEWERTAALWQGLSADEQRVLDQQVAKNYQVFPTSSAGRLFDAVSALLGVCRSVTYEGQAAIELESRAAGWQRENEVRGNAKKSGDAEKSGDTEREKIKILPYPVEFADSRDGLQILVVKLFRSIIEDILDHQNAGKIAYRFHLTVASAIVQTIRRLNVKGPVVISGGVFQNKLLTEMLLELCRTEDIEILRHKNLPPGDGGIALGQILIGNEVLKQCV